MSHVVTIHPVASLAILLCAVAVAGCGDDESSGPPLQAALQRAVDARIVPRMTALADAAEQLQSDIEAGCPSPTSDQVSSFQDGWLRLSLRWNEAATYVFGPLDDDPIVPAYIFIESMRQRGIDYTQTVREAREAAISGPETLDESFFSSLSFTEIGVLAVEALVFETSTATPSNRLEDIVLAFAATPRRCSYLTGIADRLAARTRQVADGWISGTEPFRARMLSGQLEDGSDPTVAVFVAVIEQLEFLRRRKLAAILDAQIATAARPNANPFFANLQAFLDEVETLMEAGDDAVDFFDVMAGRGRTDGVTTVTARLNAARQALNAADREQAADAFLQLEQSFRREVPEGLGIELGLNFSDGD